MDPLQKKLITITSDRRDANIYPNTSDFRTQFRQPIPFDEKRPWEVSLVSANVWYSFPNVSQANYSNGLFQYNNGVVDKQFTISEGTYTFSQLNAEIQAQITLLGDVGTNIELVPNFSTLKTTLNILGGYNVDFSVSNLYLLFGFSAAQAGAPIVAATTISDNVADITNGVDTLYIRCDVIDSSYENIAYSDILYSFVPDKPPGSAITIQPNERVHLEMKKIPELSSIRLYITDQQDRPVDFRDETCSYQLHFRQY